MKTGDKISIAKRVSIAYKDVMHESTPLCLRGFCGSGNKMDHNPATRRYLAWSLALILVAGYLACSPTLPSAQTFVAMQYTTKGFNDEYGRKAIIARAMNIVNDRFRRIEVLREAHELSGDSYFIAGGYWESCGMHRQNQLGYKDLLWYQMSRLAVSVPFPDIEIYGYYKENETLGRAQVGTLKVLWAGNAIDWKGKFKVGVNCYHLGSAGQGSDPETWASVIAHEMLHNLGHLHPECNYDLEYQVNAFSHAVFIYGKTNWIRITRRFDCE